MSTSNAVGDVCLCDDPALDRIRAAIAAGIDQRLASLREWAPWAVPGRVSVSERLRARLAEAVSAR